MTGRGRPRKAKSPDTNCENSKTKPKETKQVSLPRCPDKDFTGARQNGTTKEQKPKEQKKTNHTEEKPSVQGTRKEKTTNHSPEEINKQERTPTDNTKPPVQGTKAKTCASRAKQAEQCAEEITKTQPETTKDTAKDSLKTAKAKTCGGKTKSKEKLPEEMTKMQQETLQDTTKDTLNATKAKTRGGEAKPPVKFDEKTKMEAKTPTDITKACVSQPSCKDKAAVDTILSSTLAKLKIKRNDRSDASQVINEIIKHIVTHLKQNTQCFKEVEEPLHTGSYYENLKISNPDEFDVMLPIPVDRVTVEPFKEDGAFYSVALKRGNRTLQKFQETNTLSASKMLEEFREEVKKSVKGFKEWELTKKKKGCPAVTLITKVQSITISLDVVLCLMVKSSWPPFTKDGLKIEGWLGTKVKQEYKRKAYYLVPKYEGRGSEEHDGVLTKDIWRVSFSHIEKAILRNHGSEKTCCEKNGAPCCRKDCLKLLKHLLSLLKERDPSFDKFCSYHAKTTLLHACCSRTKDCDWRASDLSLCFQQLLRDFVARLEDGELYNFFIPTQNLLSGPGQKKCTKLAQCIREECEKGFPIFK